MKYPLQSLLFGVLAGVVVQAHAHDLCINSDGSLNDTSVSKETIAVDMLPSCKNQEPKAAEAPNAGVEFAKKREGAPAQPTGVAKTGDKRVSLPVDCQTANGESWTGYIGAAELLPACML